MEKRPADNRIVLPLLLVTVLTMFLLLHDLFGGTLLKATDYNSYTLQAMAWRSGSFGLGKDYPWLELAVYRGDWYVSFPPVPTLVMLPLTFLFGTGTPDNLVMLEYALLMVLAAYYSVRRIGASERASAFWAMFVALGSNMLWMCTDGAVWFMAQALNMVLCLYAIFCAVSRRRVLSLIFTALAVGCRPFSILLFLPLLALFIEEDIVEKGMSPKAAVLSQWKVLIGPALIGLCYMIFNYARFRNPFEFGHSFLPEFNRGEPQFSVSFILRNLPNIFRPVMLRKNLSLSYSIYDGFLFFVANPFFVILFTRLKKLRPYQWVALAAMVVNLVLLLMHRTFGGWQFGARYTVDLLSYAFLICLPGLKKTPRNWELFLGVFAILFNLYGAVAMHFLHG
ncbi:MAG: hypothetical protein IJK14_05570 [Clostridia bacterium]|nr:hypothetical protein [Clostridia bacterium]